MTSVSSENTSVIVSIEDDEVILVNTESPNTYVSFVGTETVVSVEPISVYVDITANAIPGLNDANRTYEFVHTQGSPSDVWIINHDLNKYCSVTIVDSGKNVVFGNIQYNSLTQITVSFESEFSGQAFLN